MIKEKIDMFAKIAKGNQLLYLYFYAARFYQLNNEIDLFE